MTTKETIFRSLAFSTVSTLRSTLSVSCLCPCVSCFVLRAYLANQVISNKSYYYVALSYQCPRLKEDTRTKHIFNPATFCLYLSQVKSLLFSSFCLLYVFIWTSFDSCLIDNHATSPYFISTKHP